MMTQEELNTFEKPSYLVSNQQMVEEIYQALLDAPQDLDKLRGALRRALAARAWTERLDLNRKRPFHAESFRQFITAPWPEGLGTSEPIIRRLIADDPDLLVAFVTELDRGQGGNNNPYGRAGKPDEGINHTNSMVDSDQPSRNGHDEQRTAPDTQSHAHPHQPAKTIQGTTAAYIIRRLVRAAEGGDQKAADLLDRLRHGEISPNRASKEMNWRRDKTPLEQLRHWWGKASAEERRQFEAERGWSPA